jgi:hypothetical protein
MKTRTLKRRLEMIRRVTIGLGAAVLALSMAASTALAAQPGVECDDFSSAPAGFSTGGFANAESQYANPDAQGGLSSGNWHVVSQYDVACEKVSNH